MAANMNSNWAPAGPLSLSRPMPKNALQVREQHLDLLAIATGLLIGSGLRHGASNVTCRLILMPCGFSGWRLRTASGFEGAVLSSETRE